MDNVHEESWSTLFGSAQEQHLNSSNLSQIIYQLTQGAVGAQADEVGDLSCFVLD